MRSYVTIQHRTGTIRLKLPVARTQERLARCAIELLGIAFPLTITYSTN